MKADLESAYVGYAYSYPHKSAYGPLGPPVPLGEAWRDEAKDSLFLYLHVPYCEMRCGFCNLFARSRPREEEVASYVRALGRQARRVREALGSCRVSRLALGGGTPTTLGARALDELFDIAEREFGASPSRLPASVETSPGTAGPEVLAVLRRRGVRRLSLGVQSFDDAELAAIGRPERADRALEALSEIRASGFPTLNIDLIYGIPGQTDESWVRSLRTALRFAPEELYLYPLYIRPMTGMARMPGPEEDRRLRLYRVARAFLLEAGYRQGSMRMFARGDAAEEDGPAYCCQDDGMIGLGPGARSYTRSLHYSTRYAVTRGGIREILERYASAPEAAFDQADYGVRLGEEEQKRRWLIKSILRAEGFRAADYARRFGTPLLGDFPDLPDLERQGLARLDGGRVVLSDAGLERSDTIGPRLYSPEIRRRMERFVLR
jgi:oxygen-independent coproporphyrinogen-3 oxidase